MINDNNVSRAEFISWLKSNGLYNPMYSAHEMQLMNDVYWAMKEQNDPIMASLKDLIDSCERCDSSYIADSIVFSKSNIAKAEGA